MNDSLGEAPNTRPAFARALRALLSEGYSAKDFRADAVAGAIVGIVALPLSMALAIATGVAPQHGIYTAIVAGVLIALLGGSRCLVSGPTAVFVALLLPLGQRFGVGGLALATAMAGVMLIAVGVLRLGRFVLFVPSTVVTGFTAGIAVTIATAQISNLTGMTGVSAKMHWHEVVCELIRCAGTIDPWDVAVGLFALVLLVWLRRALPRVPAPLLAVGLAAVAAALLESAGVADVVTIADRFSWTAADGSVHGGIPPWPPTFRWPWEWPGPGGEVLRIDYDMIKQLALAAVTICVFGAIESTLSARVADAMSGTRHDADGELLAQGIGNLVVPFFGGFAATGSIARTATNIQAGARSPIASIVHAVFLLASVLALAPLLGRMPMSALAALLLTVAWRMVDVRYVVHMLRTAPRADVGVMATCFLLTVAFDMVVGVSAGIMLAALLFLRRMRESTGAKLMGNGHHELRAPLPQGVHVYEVNGPLLFGAAERAMTTLHAVARHVRVVVLDLEGVPMIDATGMVNLRSTLARLRADHTRVVLTGLRDNVSARLHRAGVVADNTHVFERPTLDDGVSLASELLRSTAPEP